jgi:hypothetical protein
MLKISQRLSFVSIVSSLSVALVLNTLAAQPLAVANEARAESHTHALTAEMIAAGFENIKTVGEALELIKRLQPDSYSEIRDYVMATGLTESFSLSGMLKRGTTIGMKGDSRSFDLSDLVAGHVHDGIHHWYSSPQATSFQNFKSLVTFMRSGRTEASSTSFSPWISSASADTTSLGLLAARTLYVTSLALGTVAFSIVIGAAMSIGAAGALPFAVSMGLAVLVLMVSESLMGGFNRYVHDVSVSCRDGKLILTTPSGVKEIDAKLSALKSPDVENLGWGEWKARQLLCASPALMAEFKAKVLAKTSTIGSSPQAPGSNARSAQ